MNETVLHRESNNISLSVLLENFSKYNLNPPGQRKSVWSEEKESFLIDSILRNFPIPPIFIRQIIDPRTGSTKYDVIDGKQRLTAIKKFAENKLPVATDEDPNDENYSNDIAGKYFNDLTSPYQEKFRLQFWRYSIPIEYIESKDSKIIDSIFDRLNRNGEALTKQELRNSKYHDNPFHQKVIELSMLPFWEKRLESTDKRRMENHEFIAELFATLHGGKCVNSNPKDIEKLYATHTKLSPAAIRTTAENFSKITQVMNSLSVKYDEWKVSGVSHLYALWVFAVAVNDLNVPIAKAKAAINTFFTAYRSDAINSDTDLIDYRRSMTTNTKSRSMRMMRIRALLSHCKVAYVVK